MLSHKWNFWGATVRGTLHVIEGIPNQDSWMSRRYKWGNVIVVSDGLGSKKHSEYGSKAACLAVFEAAKCYQSNPEANIVNVLQLIHAIWLVKIAPYSPSECSATCLFAIQTDRFITLGRLGDGMIAICGEDEASSLVLRDNKEDSFSNCTNSLQQEFEPDEWEISSIDNSDCKAVVLCTDGVSEDLLSEMQINFAQELSYTYADLETKQRRRDLKLWLNEWPGRGHSDDKTIACLYKRGQSK